ncbi:MAG: radical SAM protein, partial [Thermodesulfobacteriota bacterium]
MARMEFTRRDFIKSSLFLGGSLLISPASLYALQKKEGRWIPAYEKLEKEGKLAQRVEQAYAIFENCQLCPRRCGVNRKKGEKGFCRAPLRPVIFSYHLHFGEEMSIVGQNGSGTIFFSNCGLRCV